MLKEMLDFFLYYLEERDKIYRLKEAGKPKPWTEDPILQSYKFTNILRERDKTTKWMRKNWTEPNKDKDLKLQLLNCAIFRYFGTIEYASEIGWQETFDPEYLKNTAKNMMDKRKKVFTGAYVITNNGIKGPKYEVVVDHFLTNFWDNIDRLIEIGQETHSWEAVTKAMIEIKGFGEFMTKEILQDAIKTPVLDHVTDLHTYTPIGPGAHRGINRLLGYPIKKKLSYEETYNTIIALHHRALEILPEDVKAEYDLHSTQFNLCEFDKYLRVKFDNGRLRSRYAGV